MYLTPTSASVGKVDDSELENGCRKNLEWQYIGSKVNYDGRGDIAKRTQSHARSQYLSTSPTSSFNTQATFLVAFVFSF